MALNDDAVITPAVGHILTAEPGTPNPSALEIDGFDPEEGFVDWENLGHTSRDGWPELGFGGGDCEVRGAWQNASLRTVTTEAPLASVVCRLPEMTAAGRALYYGPNVQVADGELVVPDTPVGAVKRALLTVI